MKTKTIILTAATLAIGHTARAQESGIAQPDSLAPFRISKKPP